MINLPDLELARDCDTRPALGHPMNEQLDLAEAEQRSAAPLQVSAEDRALLAKLSPKQREALKLVLLGKTSKDMARELGVSPSALDQRLDSARRILGVSDRAKAARKFYELHCACERLTGDPFLVGPVATDRGSGERDPSHYVFGDALTFTAPAAWERNAPAMSEAWRGFAPGLPSATSRPEQRIMWIVIGALAILALVILGLAAVEGLTRLDAIV